MSQQHPQFKRVTRYEACRGRMRAVWGPALLVLLGAGCASPADSSVPEVNAEPTVELQLWESGGGSLNHGVSPATPPISLAKVHAPQCSGVTYAVDDPAPADEGARALTVAEVGPTTCEATGNEPVCTAPNVGSIYPQVYGVIAGGSRVVGGALDQWASTHQNVGLPLAGVPEGSCGSCSEALGQQCVAGVCRSYPVVADETQITLTGINFWDLISPVVRLTKVVDTVAHPGDVAAPFDISASDIGVVSVASTAERVASCDKAPVTLTGNLPPQGSVAGPNEDRVDKLVFLPRVGNVSSQNVNRFYDVQVINNNGNYFQRGEAVPVDLAMVPTSGRTLHICNGSGLCTVPDPTADACSVDLAPGCSAAGGGLWSTPPKSLTQCRVFDPINNSPQCPETPLYFASPVTAPDGAPLRIFIAP